MFDHYINGTCYSLHGTENKGCVTLIHGLGLNTECWQWNLPELQKEFRVITYDLYGHGKSIAPPLEPNLSLFSQQLEELLDHLSIKETGIVGFSLGGMIARKFVQENPHRTKALAILNSPHKRSQLAQKEILNRVELARAEGPKATVEAALLRWFTDSYRKVNPVTMELVRSWVCANNSLNYHKIYKILADGVQEIISPSPPIRVPTIVVTGEEDFGNSPEMAQAIAAEIDGAKLHVLKGLRHMSIVEDPILINKLLSIFFGKVFSEKKNEN